MCAAPSGSSLVVDPIPYHAIGDTWLEKRKAEPEGVWEKTVMTVCATHSTLINPLNTNWCKTTQETVKQWRPGSLDACHAVRRSSASRGLCVQTDLEQAST